MKKATTAAKVVRVEGTGADFIAVIRTSTGMSGGGVFVKGPFASVREASAAARAHIENANGYGGCGDVLIVPVVKWACPVHEVGCHHKP